MKYSINDPIYKMMTFSSRHSQLIKPIIDTPFFQRLRQIKQLGLVQLVFPGAVNTRFNHCLGASYLANLIAQQIGLDAERNDLAVVAALVHDIGHGPFSHMFERLLPADKKIKHDDEWLDCFLTLLKDKKVLSNDHFKACRSVFSLSEKSDQLSIVSDIVTSQLDADRLDYLLRDSYYCGVTYGKFNFKWLLSCMHKVDVSGADRLGVVQKGMGALEHYIMCRRLMTKNIYANGKVNGARHFLQEFLSLLSEQIDGSQFSRIRSTVLGQYCFLLQQYIQGSIDKEAFIEQSFQFYQELIDADIWLVLRECAKSSHNDTVNTLARRIYYRQLPHAISVKVDQMNSYRDQVDNFLQKNPHVEKWQCHLEQLDFISYENKYNPISVEGASSLFDFLSENIEPTCWLYLDREVADSFNKFALYG